MLGLFVTSSVVPLTPPLKGMLREGSDAHMPNIKPKTKWQRRAAGEFWFESVLAIIVIANGVIQGLRIIRADSHDTDLAIGLFVASGVGGIALVVRAFSRRRNAQNGSADHSLDGLLHALHAIVASQRPDANVRICIYVPCKPDDKLHQRTNYVGESPGIGEGREMSASVGIVGLSYRTGKIYYDSLPANTNVVDYLVNEYAYDRAIASALRQDRKAWAALPVGRPGAIVAVIYIDGSRPDLFGRDARCPLRKTLEAALIGVAEFINKV